MEKFLQAFDAWAVSNEQCAGPLFDAMIEARETLQGAEPTPPEAAAPALLAALKIIDEQLAGWSTGGPLDPARATLSNSEVREIEKLERIIQNAICEVEPDYLLEEEDISPRRLYVHSITTEEEIYE